MTITIPLDFDAIRGHTTRQGNAFFTDDLLRIPLPPIPAGIGAKLRLVAYVRPRAGSGRAIATMGGEHDGITAAQWFNGSYPIPAGASELIITSVEYFNLMTLSVVLDTEPVQQIKPYEALEVEVYAPRPDGKALQWDITRWNRVVWNAPAPAPGSLSWDRGYWNAKEWYDPSADTYIWQSILNLATRVTISRGMSRLGTSAIVGLLEVELKGEEYDPRALGISIGAPVRAYLRHTLTPVFAGNLVEAQINPHPTKPGETRVTLTFADAVATLANTTRYGAKADFGDGAETFTARAKRLSKSARETQFEIKQDNTPIAPTVWETSLANHFDALTATTGGYWTVTRENKVIVSPAQPALSDTIISDTPRAGSTLYYTGISEAWNSTGLVTSIESTTHAAINTPSGWEAADRVITVESPTATATWAGIRETVDLLTPLAGNAQRDAATRLLKRAANTPAIQSNTFYLETAPAGTYSMQASLDPAQRISVYRNGERHHMQIKEVNHVFTPTSFETVINY